MSSKAALKAKKRYVSLASTIVSASVLAGKCRDAHRDRAILMRRWYRRIAVSKRRAKTMTHSHLSYWASNQWAVTGIGGVMVVGLLAGAAMRRMISSKLG